MSTATCVAHPDVPTPAGTRCWQCYRDGVPVRCPGCRQDVRMPKGIEAGVICPHCDAKVYAPKDPTK